jgi:hypothetical protein
LSFETSQTISATSSENTFAPWLPPKISILKVSPFVMISELLYALSKRVGFPRGITFEDSAIPFVFSRKIQRVL